MKSTICLIFILLAATVAAAPCPTCEQAVIDVDKQLNVLVASGDAAAAQAFYSTDFVLTTSSGKRKRKPDMLREIATPELTFNVNEMRNAEVRILGDTAVLTGTLHQKGSFKGSSFDAELWVTDTWVRGGEHGWQLLAGHASRVPM